MVQNGQAIQLSQKDHGPTTGETETDSVRDVWYGFSQDSTFHGIRFITLDSANVIRRSLWAILVLVASGYLVYQIQDRVSYFLSEPILVKTELIVNKSMKFPVIAICNQNQFKLTSSVKANSNVYLEAIFGRQATVEDLYQMVLNDTGNKDVGIWNMDNETLGIFLNRTLDDLYTSLGHRPEQMIARCVWRGMNCQHSDFHPIITDHGLCYEFRGLANQPYEAKGAGADMDGLQLLLNIEQYDYSSGPHGSAGLKLLLYSEDEVPMVTTLGDGIGPGTHTFVGVTVTELHRTSNRHTKCTDGLNLTYFDKYTELSCREDCEAKRFVDICGCRKSSRWRDNGTPLCTIEQVIQCQQTLKQMKTEINDTGLGCPACDARCHTKHYETSLSSLKTSQRDADLVTEEYRVSIKANNRDALDTYVDTHPTSYQFNRKLIRDFRETAIATRKICSTKFWLGFATFLQHAATMIIWRFIQSVTNIKQYLRDSADFYDEYFILPSKFVFRPVKQYGIEVLTELPHDSRKLANTSTPEDEKTQIRERLRNDIRDFEKKLKDRKQTILDIASSYIIGQPVLPVPQDLGASFSPKYNGSFLIKVVQQAAQGAYNIGSKNLINSYRKSIDDILGVLGKTLQEIEKPTVNHTELQNLTVSCTILLINISRRYSQISDRILDYPKTKIKEFEDDIMRLATSTFSDTLHHVAYKIQKAADASFMHHYLEYQAWANKLPTEGSLNLSGISNFPAAVINATYMTQGYMLEMDKLLPSLDHGFELFVSLTIKTTFSYIQDKVKELGTNDVSARKKTLKYLDVLWLDDPKEVKDLKKHAQIIKQGLVDLQAVREYLVPRFESLKSAMDAYNEKLQSSGTFFKENFAQVDVYFQDMSYERIEQQHAYDEVALLSDIGGSMGLLIGGSCLTIFEILDTIGCCLVIILGSQRGGKTSKRYRVSTKKRPVKTVSQQIYGERNV